ncbi:hypothetical protein TI04_12540, partial [Achromatium sp. WMS2]
STLDRKVGDCVYTGGGGGFYHSWGGSVVASGVWVWIGGGTCAYFGSVYWHRDFCGAIAAEGVEWPGAVDK